MGEESKPACNWLYNYTGAGVNFTVKSCSQRFPMLYMSKFIKPGSDRLLVNKKNTHENCTLVYLNFKYGLNL